MSDNKLNDIIKSSLDGIKSITDMQTVVGSAINTPSGVTVIPVSKVSLGFAGGGIDFGPKKLASSQNFGSGSGTGVSIVPVAFLTVGKDAEVNLIMINSDTNTSVQKITSLIEHSPEIIQKIKDTFS